MTDPQTTVMAVAAALAGFGVAAAAALRAWNGWLELKRLEVETRIGGPGLAGKGRPELSDLRERVRKLEAIASGIEI